LTLHNVFLHVTVLDPSGNPVPNTSLFATGSVSIDLFSGGPATGSMSTSGTTDASGAAQLSLLPGASITITASPPPGLPQTSVTISVATDATITIQLGGP
ncbi:MAG TPA: carboxypeptidase-like regulatory domain-containing protein, partial [Gemmatimonadales bacterium]|nr:carboxypeptidase-like regulatory domain-containing protein [Gemmatimonadales bacterium]